MNLTEDTDSKNAITSVHWTAIVCWVVLNFVLGDKPVHLDEANFLAMTQGEFWAPHLIQINWEGTQQSAFDVLSNPPGMVWLLWPVKELSVRTMRLWILPWTFASIWGLWKCTQIFGYEQERLWLILCSPIFVLSHNSLMPEMPLLTCIVLGWQGILRGQRPFFWALILGSAALFRYSGMTMIPLLAAYIVFQRSNRWLVLLFGVSLPTVLLCMHDIFVYGQWHFWHMISFQQEQQSWSAVVHKLCALSSMLVLGCWTIPDFQGSKKRILILGCVAILLTGVLSQQAELSMNALAWVSVPAGIFVVSNLLFEVIRTRRYWWACWIIGGCVFLLSLRFAATRYWVPFVFPYWFLLGVPAWTRYFIPIAGLISLHLVWDDAQLAKAQHRLAHGVVELCEREYGEAGYFAGHWGWQYALEQKEWIAIENDKIIPNNVCFSMSAVSWPQETTTDCFSDIRVFESNYYSKGLPIRIHTAEGRGNYHSYMFSASPPIKTITPFGWGYDSWERVEFRRSCLR